MAFMPRALTPTEIKNINETLNVRSPKAYWLAGRILAEALADGQPADDKKLMTGYGKSWMAGRHKQLKNRPFKDIRTWYWIFDYGTWWSEAAIREIEASGLSIREATELLRFDKTAARLNIDPQARKKIQAARRAFLQANHDAAPMSFYKDLQQLRRRWLPAREAREVSMVTRRRSVNSGVTILLAKVNRACTGLDQDRKENVLRRIGKVEAQCGKLQKLFT